MDTVTHFYSKPAKYNRGQDADESRSDVNVSGKMNKDINVSYASKATKKTSDVTATATANATAATKAETTVPEEKIVFKTE